MRRTGPERHGGLADVLDDHLAAEFATRDLDATMATMTGDPYLNHVPVLTGGIGRDEVRRFYQQVFIGHWPADTTMQRISRTVGTDQVVDELVMSFTHPPQATQSRFDRAAWCRIQRATATNQLMTTGSAPPVR